MGKRFYFTVPGPPRGFLAVDRRRGRVAPSVLKRVQEMRSYRDKVRIYALQAGLKLPLEASEEFPVLVHVSCFFDSRVHPDPENVSKLLRDVLFYKAPGGDKHVGGYHSPPLYDQKNPRVEIVITYPNPDFLQGIFDEITG